MGLGSGQGEDFLDAREVCCHDRGLGGQVVPELERRGQPVDSIREATFTVSPQTS